MNGTLTYLLLIKAKNELKSLVKSPGKLVYFLLLAALIVFTSISGGSAQGNENHRDISELYAGMTAFLLIMFVLVAKNGFGNGGTIFSLTDVNILFQMPIKPRRILFYGLLQQMGTSLLLGFFLLFQYSWMSNLYGIKYITLIIFLVGYAMTVFSAQFTAMVIYSFTSADEKKKKTAKIIVYGIIVLFVAYAIISAGADKATFLPNLIEFANSTVARLFPIAGWITNIVDGSVSGDAIKILCGVSLYIVYIAAMTCLVIFTKSDYYEDVLKTAELSHSAIVAKKEGRIAESTPQNVKLGKTGLNRGFGASAIYYKHLIENRRGKVFILSATQLIFTAVTLVYSFFMRDVGIVAIFAFATYMQIFSVALGRFTRELTKPYIYLIPESSVKKLLYSMLESLSGTVVEAVLIFVPAAFMVELTVIETVLCILARVSFTALFMAGNILVERLFGSLHSKVLTMTFFILAMLLMSAPGVAIAAIITTVTETTAAVPVFMAIMTACNIPVSLLVFFLSRNMLQYAELNN